MGANLYILLTLAAVLVLALYLLSHFFLYYSVVSFFGILSPGLKIFLGVALLALALSFIFSSLLAHWKDNQLTRSLYFASGLWLGTAAALALFFAAAWAVFGLASLAGISLSLRVLGALAMAGALLFSGYGVWSAYHLRIKNISVKIKNLPEAWKNIKAAQITDVHLGHALGEDFLARVVARINAQNPDVVFITGDLFDGMDGSLHLRAAPLNDLKAPLGVYYVTGNHETYFGVPRVYEILKQTKVKILGDRMEDVKGMQILGVNYPLRGQTKNLPEVIKTAGFDPAKPSIALYHSPSQAKKFKEAGVNLMLSGHTHCGQIFPINLITRLIFGKNNCGQHSDGDFTIYTSTGAGTWGTTMRTFAPPEIVMISFE